MNKNNSNKKNNSNGAVLLLLFVAVLFAGVLGANNYYMPKYKNEFLRLEKERIVTTNKLTTAKIVQENLNHVRDLIFNNMDFPGQPDTIDHESQFFEFVTTCVNDLKLKLVSVKPVAPVENGRISTFGYDVVIEGDFFRFGEFCAKLENNRRIVSIESFGVELIGDNDMDKKRTSTDFKTENKDVRINLRINTYRISKA